MSLQTNYTYGKINKYPYWKRRQIFDSKFLFLHINKTGGTSVKDFFQKPTKGRNSHTTASNIIKEIGLEKYNTYIPFTVVRNPYDRMVSAWSYKTSRKKCPKMSFSEYVQVSNSKYWVQPQIKYLSYKETIMCSKENILKLESIKKDISEFIFRHNIELDIKQYPHKNKSRRRNKPYMEYYTSKTLELVNSAYPLDFNLGGYKIINTL